MQNGDGFDPETTVFVLGLPRTLRTVAQKREVKKTALIAVANKLLKQCFSIVKNK
jgi:hypothetical protein